MESYYYLLEGDKGINSPFGKFLFFFKRKIITHFSHFENLALFQASRLRRGGCVTGENGMKSFG
jgi:hypothetical protein